MEENFLLIKKVMKLIDNRYKNELIFDYYSRQNAELDFK